tara:strand:+ start:14142 stop:15560 length:1419 start_codon:yes stop_codon:yes gene_type:complete
MVSAKRKTYLYCFLFLLVSVVFRFAYLDLKPTHFDEGVNGFFIEEIKDQRYFDYDPSNYHGPLYFYLLTFADLSFGSSIWVHRAVATSISILSLLLLFFYRRSLNLTWMGFSLLIFSAGMQFFSRYSIHESLLQFGIILFAIAFLQFLQRDWRYFAVFFWLALLIMATSKETFVIHIFAAFVAFLFLQSKAWRQLKHLLHLPAIFIFLFLFCLLYTNAFHDWSALKDFFQAFFIWKDTGLSGQGHDKPIYYFAELLFRYEFAFFIGFFAGFYFLWKGTKTQRFMAIYTLLPMLIYSLISYKTPWCILSFLWGFAILTDWILQKIPKQNIRYIIFLPLLLTTILLSVDLNFRRYTDPKHKYVYVQSTKEMQLVVNKIKSHLIQDPSFQQTPIQIALESTWPLPWLLKDKQNISYVEQALPSAPIVIMNFRDYQPEVFYDYRPWRFFVRDSQAEAVLLIHKDQAADFYRDFFDD